MTEETKARERLARAISVILHPFIMAIFMFIYLPGKAGMKGGQYWGSIGFFLLFSFITPYFYLRYQQHQGSIAELDIRDRGQRQEHYGRFLVIYLLQFLLTLIFFESLLLRVYAAALFLNTAIYANINRFWKISIHGAGLGGPTGILIFLEGFHFWPITLTVLPLLWSRVRLRYHTPLQVLAGAALGGILLYSEYFLADWVWSI